MRKLIGIFFLSFLSCAASAQRDSTLEDSLKRALTCESSIVDGRKPETAQLLKFRGAVLTDKAPGELPDLQYDFPIPLEIDGLKVSSIRFVGGSGSIFFAVAEGHMPSFLKRHGLRPHPVKSWSLDGYEAMQAQYARAMPLRAGIDEVPPLMVAGKESRRSRKFNWGCRTFDG